jgi:hypothetical protein
MNISRLCLALIVLGLTASISMADSVDPRFMPIGGGGSIILGSPTDSAFQFSFTKNGDVGTVLCNSVHGGGGPTGDRCIDPANTEFVNNSGKTWTSVTLEVTAHSDDLTFSPFTEITDPYFLNAASGTAIDGNPTVTFSGIDEGHPGILPAFGCPDGPSTCTGPTVGDGDFPLFLYDFAILSEISDMADGDSFTVQGSATTVAEPPAVFLALGGGLLLLFFKRS